MIRHVLFLNLFGLAVLFSQGQDSSKLHLNWQVYGDVYLAVDNSRPADNRRPAFTYNHTRDRGLRPNLLLAQASATGKSWRTSLGIMTGTYAGENLASEPAFWRAIYEASAGFKLSRRQALWLDAGVFPSHIGAESAIGINHPTLTRSLAAENSPYYETGLRLSYTPSSGTWSAALLLLNGWQHIRRTPGNTGRSLGTQFTWTPNKKFTLNWSQFAGNDKPDTARQFRLFQNIYGLWQASSNWYLVLAFDIGWQRKRNQPGYDRWFTPQLVAQYKPADRWAFAVRAEYYADPAHVIIAPQQPGTRFRTAGFSLNADRRFGKYFTGRVEWKTYRSPENLFLKNGLPVNSNSAFTATVCFQAKGEKTVRH
jgi:hypothetical protein